MFDKTINVKTIDLSGVNLPSDDGATCDLIYSALSTTYGFPLYLENFKVNGVKHDSVLVNPIISENQTIINLNDCHLIVTPTGISVGNGVYGAFLESIVDKDGNPRFIEGDLSTATISNITFSYGKWSLSGTHLMIVLAGKIASGTFLGGYLNLASAFVPNYILNKVRILIPNRSDILRQKFFVYKENAEIIADKLFYLSKQSDNLNIGSSAVDPFTASEDGYFRIQFDLLIDDEYDE